MHTKPINKRYCPIVGISVQLDDFFHHTHTVYYTGVRTMLFLKTKLAFMGINKQFDPF